MEQAELPPPSTKRAPLSEVKSSTSKVGMEGEESVGADTEGSGESPTTACPDAELTPAVKEIQQRVMAKFTDAGKVMVDSRMGRVRCKSTHLVLGRAIEAINNVFDQQRGRLCQSPERPDLTISKEEGLGWLLAEMFFCELLVAEARGLGKRVGKQPRGAWQRIGSG